MAMASTAKGTLSSQNKANAAGLAAAARLRPSPWPAMETDNVAGLIAPRSEDRALIETVTTSVAASVPSVERAMNAISKALTELQCQVCLDTLVMPETTPCGHIFCALCLCRWLRKRPTCPACKRPVDAGACIRLVGLGDVAQTLLVAKEGHAVGYEVRVHEARLELSSSVESLRPRQMDSGSMESQTRTSDPETQRLRMLQATAVLTPLRLREFRLPCDMHPIAEGTWENMLVDFELESVGAPSESWEPMEWCWTARVPFTAIVGQTATSIIELRLIAGSHNRILDPGDEDERFCLRLEAYVDEYESRWRDSVCWLMLQIAFVAGAEEGVIALPFAIALGAPFASPHVVQPAQSCGLAGRGATSQDHCWSATRRLVHTVAVDLLVNLAALQSTSARRHFLDTVISVRGLEYDTQHLVQVGDDAVDEVEGFRAAFFRNRPIEMPLPTRAACAR